jgi:hypothetical protein
VVLLQAASSSVAAAVPATPANIRRRGLDGFGLRPG